MAIHLKVTQDERVKGKSSSKTQEAAEELAYLMTFSQSITQAIARTIQDLLDLIFINMSNVMLLRHDSYLDLLKPGVNFDTVTALRTSRHMTF